MRKDVVVLGGGGGIGDDDAHLMTTDPKVADRYGLVDESEFWDVDDEPAGP